MRHENLDHIGTVTEHRFEHRRDAQGLGTGRPRLSWTTLAEGGAGWRQAAYEVELIAADGGGPRGTAHCSAGSVVSRPAFRPDAGAERFLDDSLPPADRAARPGVEAAVPVRVHMRAAAIGRASLCSGSGEWRPQAVYVLAQHGGTSPWVRAR